MYKIYTKILCWQQRLIPKNFLPVKFTVAIFFMILLQANATAYAQKITLHSRNITLKQFFNAIRQQTAYDVLYQPDKVNESLKINVDFEKTPLKEVLDKTLSNHSLEFTIEEKTIMIKPRGPVSEKSTVIPSKGITVTGRVIDSIGRPIPSATISLTLGEKKRATTTIIQKKTATDSEGIFSIADVQPGNYILTITSIGFQAEAKDLNITLDGPTNLGSFTVKEAISSLMEASINTGYQVIKPEQSTGSVARISTKEYESRISTDFLSGLVNKLPGLVINNDVKFSSSLGGGQSTNSLFNIRGISTMTGNQNPLIVIDGYPTELSINMIDPNEIKSVTILKDAAAATIYGVRASNGVIVIERKQAAVGRPQIAFRATAGFTAKENYSRYRWAADASTIGVNYSRDIYATSVNSTSWNSLLSTFVGYSLPYYVMAQQAAGIITPNQANESFAALGRYNNVADFSKLFQQTAATQTYNLNISGGSPNALYYLTSNYTGNRLQQIDNSNNRIQLSGRSLLKFSDRFSLELTTDYQQQHIKTAPTPNIGNIASFEHFKDADGNPLAINSRSVTNPFYNSIIMAQGLEDALYYPLIDLNEVSDKTRIVNNRITANLKYKIGYGFDFTFGGIYENSNTEIDHYASQNSSETHQYIDAYATKGTDGKINFNIPRGGFLKQQKTNSSSYTLRAQLNYNKQIGKDHSINAILGSEVRDATDQGNSAAYFGYNDQNLLHQPVDYLDINKGNINGAFQIPGYIGYENLFAQQYRDNRYISGYSNIVYAFRDTYSLTGSMRIDQSNLFGTDPKYKYKPLWSIGGAWNIDREHFLQNVSWIKQLKVRVAQGFNGNVAKLSLPQAIAQAYTNTNSDPASTALAKYAYANSGLRWEQTNNFNLGLDFGLVSHITGSIDYYNKKSTDLLSSTYIDPTIGSSPSLINTASINNKGLEINVHADWITTKNFNWNTGFVLSHNTSKVLKVYQNLEFSPSKLNGAGYIQGYPVGAVFAYRWAGLDNTGTPMVADQQGKTYTKSDPNIQNVIQDGSSGVIKYMGSSLPTINAGLSNRIDVGHFYFYAMINYYGGFKVFVPRPSPADVRPLSGAGNYWKKAGDEKNTDIMSLANFSEFSYAVPVYNYTDKYVVNGDYLTLGDITASYSFDKSLFLKKIGFSHFEVKLQASNVLTVGLNKYNYSLATGSYAKSYLTPTYTVGLFTNL